jgi:hypothetical protein
MNAKRIGKYLFLFFSVGVLLLSGMYQAFAADHKYWMPRTTLKDDLKVREAPRGSSATVFKVSELLKQLSQKLNLREVHFFQIKY